MIFRNAFFLLMACVFVANAADGAVSRAAASSSVLMPVFYDEPVMRWRDGAVQTPVSLEGPIDSNYIVGPGDFLEIILPNLQEGLQVSPEGTIAIQGHGLVEINGLALNEAKRKIMDKLKNRYDQKSIGVHLVQLRRYVVKVQGAVNNPGQVTVSGQSRVKGAIYAAGNFKPWANKDSVCIYRMGDTIVTNENMLLQAGDIIDVPSKEWHQTIDLGYSGKIVTIPYIPGRTLKEYVEDLGIGVETGYGAVSAKYPLDGFTRWVDIGQIGNFVPEPLTEIEFHVRAPFVYVGGAVMAVGKVPYNPAMHAMDYVAASGVTIITGNFSRISVLRDGKEFSVDNVKDEILPGDFIEIPRGYYEQAKDVTLFITSILSIVATTLTIYIATR
jgi:protein involved in polysaccharide export with SLBB domain